MKQFVPEIGKRVFQWHMIFCPIDYLIIGAVFFQRERHVEALHPCLMEVMTSKQRLGLKDMVLILLFLKNLHTDTEHGFTFLHYDNNHHATPRNRLLLIRHGLNRNGNHHTQRPHRCDQIR